MIEQTILSKLDEILARLDNHTKLAERREKHREASARYRKNHKTVISPNCVISPKENEDGKEDTSPAPLIREKGEAKENAKKKENWTSYT